MVQVAEDQEMEFWIQVLILPYQHVDFAHITNICGLLVLLFKLRVEICAILQMLLVHYEVSV